MEIQRSEDYMGVMQNLKERIHRAQLNALQSVNKELISLYWDIGRIIIEKQEQLRWGESIVSRMARDLQAEFPGVRGFSTRNLRYMRSFYIAYKDQPILQALLANLSWTHHLEILVCKNPQQQEFYLKMAANQGWSYRVLSHQIDSKAYERWLLNQTNFDNTLAGKPEQYRSQAKLAVHDDYNFDFLEIAERHLEHELEDELVRNITRFLGELGSYFTFVGRQYRLEVGGEEFFLDLLFYNRELQCLMAIELKTGEFKPEYGSKMNFYLSALDSTVKLPHENSSVGIIICKSKNRTIVEYTLRDVNKPIAVATYNHYSTLKELPERIARYLPSPDEIRYRLSDLPGDTE